MYQPLEFVLKARIETLGQTDTPRETRLKMKYSQIELNGTGHYVDGHKEWSLFTLLVKIAKPANTLCYGCQPIENLTSQLASVFLYS